MNFTVDDFINILDNQKTYLVRLNSKLHFETQFDTQGLKDIQEVIIAASKVSQQISRVIIQFEEKINLSTLRLIIDQNIYSMRCVLDRISRIISEREVHSSPESLADTVIIASSDESEEEWLCNTSTLA
ncbi:uncharacterized protein LOC103317814 isoform X5 [Nasonia vitripennis]|uniref:Uncharacterized protein n=1 Tax=Nasonia vitripennis TaxID=7425 RepID=A0A7M7M635_NASVI|nr:uncharacterized protein LOC103317814 isoform X5 [Nasonia vitripennis]